MLYLQSKVEADAVVNYRLASLIRILKEVSIPQYELWLCQSECGTYYIQIQFDEVCNYSGASGYRALCREWMITKDKFEDESHIIRTCWKAYWNALEHEASEKFTYKGKRVFDPHTIHLA